MKNRNGFKKIRYGKWKFSGSDHDNSKNISQTLNISPVTAAVMVNRGLKKPAEASNFLNPRLTLLKSPWDMPGMETAVAIIKKHIDSGQKILIFGDYDVDGVTGVSLLFSALKELGAQVFYYIPHREKEGYGLNKKVIQASHRKNISLIITVDCGITSTEEIKLASSLGVTTIITDHHQSGPELPEAAAILNPKTTLDKKNALYYLAGVGVVFKLVQALSEKIGWFDWQEFLDLVALGTIADMVPLTGENRVLAVAGLKLLNSDPRPGIRHLARQAGAGELDTRAIGFVLGPRLNAAGRLDHARTSIELLLAREEAQAGLLAGKLNSLNQERQQICAMVKETAIRMIEKDPSINQEKLLILEGEHWHAGVIGIVASQLAETYDKPVIIISLDGRMGKASARSRGNFNLHEIFHGLEHLFVSFGGHAQALGFTINLKNMAALKKELFQRTGHLLAEDFLPELNIEAGLELADVGPELLAELGNFAPFGEGNQVPVLAALDLKPIDYRLVKDRHLKLVFARGNRMIEAIGWDMAQDLATVQKHPALDLAFVLEANNYGGQNSVQLNLRGIRPSENKI